MFTFFDLGLLVFVLVIFSMGLAAVVTYKVSNTKLDDEESKD